MASKDNLLLIAWGKHWTPNYLKKLRFKFAISRYLLFVELKIRPKKKTKKKKHEHDIVYHVNCLKDSCEDSYIDESGRRLVQRVKDHHNWDNK